MAYFINQIVLGEESDDLGTHDMNKALCHYNLYLRAMGDVGADSKPIEKFLKDLNSGTDWRRALKKVSLEDNGIPPSTLEFVNHTLMCGHSMQTHELASSFLFGREDPIPHMFQKLLDNFKRAGL